MQKVKGLIKKILPGFVKDYVLKRLSFLVVPSDLKSVVSDQFPFRNSKDWKTYFELLNLPALFDPMNLSAPYKTSLIFFDADGKIIHKYETTQNNCERNTLAISKLLSEVENCETGTFSCFHEYFPEWLQKEKGHLAERGYVGFQNTSISNTKGYVHGNFDAIAKAQSGNLLSLGRSDWRKWQYRLQHELTGEAIYELALVNTTKRSQKIDITVIASASQETIDSSTLNIPSRGIRWYKLKVASGQRGRVLIDSNLNLARPVVFRSTENSFDVFHG